MDRYRLRPLAPAPAEVRAVTACVVDGGWGSYRQFHAAFAYYSTEPSCQTLVAFDAEGAVAGTATATTYERTGWIGHVFVRPDLRREGLGRQLTGAAIAHLEKAGCETVLLAATAEGRPLYEALGFVVESEYHELRGRPRAKSSPIDAFRPLLPGDSPALAELDRAVGGDDRGAVLARWPALSWGVDAAEGLVGALLPAPWGGAGAVLLPSAEPSAVDALVNLVCTAGAVGDEVIVYPPSENRLALARLREEGFEELRRIPRMRLGRPHQWVPEALWNPLSLGLG